MRKLIASTIVLATCLSAVSPVPGLAQAVATRTTAGETAIDPVVVATVKAFPAGGQTLTDRIMMLVLQDNNRAADVARYLMSREVLSAPQREAVEKGLAEALKRLGISAQVGDDYTALLALLLTLGVGAGAGFGAANSNHGSTLPLIVSPH
jgi:hypothetical protein